MNYINTVYTKQLMKYFLFPLISKIDINIWVQYNRLLTYLDKTVLYYIIHDFNDCHKKVFKMKSIPIRIVKTRNSFKIFFDTCREDHKDGMFYEYMMIMNKKFMKLLTNKPFDSSTTHEYKKFDILSIRGINNKYISMSKFITNTVCDAKHLSLVFQNSASDILYIDDNLDEIKLSENELVPITNI
jgi:hypothetical protein